MGNYFQKSFRPDIIDGDVSKVIQSNKTDQPFANGDILFDWHPVDIPLGTNAITDVLIHMFGEDGGAQTACDLHLLIAKSNNGVAPTTLGEENAAITGCFELQDILIGVIKMEGSVAGTGSISTVFGTAWYYPYPNGLGAAAVIEPEPNNLGGQSTNRIYVACIAGGDIDFSTGVLSDGGESSDSATSLTTKTVDPRKCFRPGDTVYIHDVDTAIGTIASMTATNITLNAAIAGGTDIADEDEFMNATPIKVTLGFAGR
jgi:hypothetical protein